MGAALARLTGCVGTLFLTTIASRFAYVWFQMTYRAFSGHYLTPKSLTSMFGFGISGVSIAFVCLNPFFEELIVRAYTISELTNLGVSGAVASAIIVALQVSYHLYQGTANVLILIVVFAGFSIYYTRTRRIFPVILVHLGTDLYYLLSGKF